MLSHRRWEMVGCMVRAKAVDADKADDSRDTGRRDSGMNHGGLQARSFSWLQAAKQSAFLFSFVKVLGRGRKTEALQIFVDPE